MSYIAYLRNFIPPSSLANWATFINKERDGHCKVIGSSDEAKLMNDNTRPKRDSPYTFRYRDGRRLPQSDEQNERMKPMTKELLERRVEINLFELFNDQTLRSANMRYPKVIVRGKTEKVLCGSQSTICCDPCHVHHHANDCISLSPCQNYRSYCCRVNCDTVANVQPVHTAPQHIPHNISSHPQHALHGHDRKPSLKHPTNNGHKSVLKHSTNHDHDHVDNDGNFDEEPHQPNETKRISENRQTYGEQSKFNKRYNGVKVGKNGRIRAKLRIKGNKAKLIRYEKGRKRRSTPNTTSTNTYNKRTSPNTSPTRLEEESKNDTDYSGTSSPSPNSHDLPSHQNTYSHQKTASSGKNDDTSSPPPPPSPSYQAFNESSPYPQNEKLNESSPPSKMLNESSLSSKRKKKITISESDKDKMNDTKQSSTVFKELTCNKESSEAKSNYKKSQTCHCVTFSPDSPISDGYSFTQCPCPSIDAYYSIEPSSCRIAPFSEDENSTNSSHAPSSPPILQSFNESDVEGKKINPSTLPSSKKTISKDQKSQIENPIRNPYRKRGWSTTDIKSFQKKTSPKLQKFHSHKSQSYRTDNKDRSKRTTYNSTRQTTDSSKPIHRTKPIRRETAKKISMKNQLPSKRKMISKKVPMSKMRKGKKQSSKDNGNSKRRLIDYNIGNPLRPTISSVERYLISPSSSCEVSKSHEDFFNDIKNLSKPSISSVERYLPTSSQKDKRAKRRSLSHFCCEKQLEKSRLTYAQYIEKHGLSKHLKKSSASDSRCRPCSIDEFDLGKNIFLGKTVKKSSGPSSPNSTKTSNSMKNTSQNPPTSSNTNETSKLFPPNFTSNQKSSKSSTNSRNSSTKLREDSMKSGKSSTKSPKSPLKSPKSTGNTSKCGKSPNSSIKSQKSSMKSPKSINKTKKNHPNNFNGLQYVNKKPSIDEEKHDQLVEIEPGYKRILMYDNNRRTINSYDGNSENIPSKFTNLSPEANEKLSSYYVTNGKKKELNEEKSYLYGINGTCNFTCKLLKSSSNEGNRIDLKYEESTENKYCSNSSDKLKSSICHQQTSNMNHQKCLPNFMEDRSIVYESNNHKSFSHYENRSKLISPLQHSRKLSFSNDNGQNVRSDYIGKSFVDITNHLKSFTNDGIGDKSSSIDTNYLRTSYIDSTLPDDRTPYEKSFDDQTMKNHQNSSSWNMGKSQKYSSSTSIMEKSYQNSSPSNIVNYYQNSSPSNIEKYYQNSSPSNIEKYCCNDSSISHMEKYQYFSCSSNVGRYYYDDDSSNSKLNKFSSCSNLRRYLPYSYTNHIYKYPMIPFKDNEFVRSMSDGMKLGRKICTNTYARLTFNNESSCPQSCGDSRVTHVSRPKIRQIKI
ncbi:hypothetical protein SNEBB_010249 [Seison nebaliae]|nr:hypothetical protein SNEBB_010249 [Seison nebaliae]